MKFFQKGFNVMVVVVIISSINATAFAGDFFANRDVWQGTVVEILVPKYNYDGVEVRVDGKLIDFYNYTAEPLFDEPISRAEFLKLMFENVEFPDEVVKENVDFPDVIEEDPYYEYVQKAANLDLVHGYEDGLFRPNATITRGQISKVLVRAFDPESRISIAPRFEDVPENHIFYEYIDDAVKAEIFKGYPDGLMRPDREINVSEAEIVIQRAAGLEEEISSEQKQYFRGLLGFHRNKDNGVKTVHVKYLKSGEVVEEKFFDFNVLERSYRVQKFSIPSQKMALFDDSAMNKTWEMIDGAKLESSDQKLWDGEFIVPTEGVETLGFGDIIYINGVYSGSHFGNDYANVEGTAINASNNGIVALSDYTPSYGNTVVLDHGHNVFTMYIHMSELKCDVGQYVEKGELIGLMGTTGISSGSHLHFTFFVDDVVVDSAEWYLGLY